MAIKRPDGDQLLFDSMALTISDLEDAIERVRELHKTVSAYLDLQPICIQCRTVEFPCPTIKALDGEQNG